MKKSGVRVVFIDRSRTEEFQEFTDKKEFLGQMAAFWDLLRANADYLVILRGDFIEGEKDK